MAKAALPVVKKEEKVGQRYGQLDPLPAGGKVGNSRKKYDSEGKEHLDHNPHHPPLL